METLECIKKRRSIRSYKGDDVPWEDLVKILDAGRLAPSAGNLQGIFFIVVKDKKKREKLAEAAFYQMWMKNAPVIIAVAVNEKIYESFYGERGKNLYSIMDVSAATENIILAATDLGYGTCWVSAFDEKKIKEILEIEKDNIRVHVLITLGKPTIWPPTPPKKKLEQMVFVEKWEGKVEKKIFESKRGVI